MASLYVCWGLCVIFGLMVLHQLDRLSKQLAELTSEVSRMRTSTAGALWTVGFGPDKPTLERVIDELSDVRSSLAEVTEAQRQTGRPII